MTDKKSKEDIKESFGKLSKAFEEARIEREAECDEFWESMSIEDKEKAFYSVCKRIFDGDVNLGGSYRYVLYDVFGFDPGMYVQGMDCGYMEIHNMIFDAKELDAMKNVTRLEVIDSTGRMAVKYLKDNERISFDLQDDDKTLKIFVDDTTWKKDL